jgi:hypothetical protein
MSIVPSTEIWIFFRNLRNNLSQKYPESIDKTAENLNLFFSKLNFSIRPNKHSMIIFPSGEKYIHGVRPPGDGPLRYVLPSFVKRKGEYGK